MKKANKIGKKVKKVKVAKPKKIKSKKVEQVKPQIIEKKKVKLPKKQKALFEKKAKLTVKARQTKWAPVWVIFKKFGMGKKIHPSRITKHRRSWRRTKLHIKPRKIRKWHMG